MSTSDTSTKKQWVLALCIPPLIWIASIVPAELAFRALGRQPADAVGGYYVPFGDNGFKIRPFAETRYNWWAGPFTVRTDALGLRIPDEADPEAYAQKPDERLWLVIGDSQGFGNGLPYEESVVGLMAARAREHGVMIRNLSIGGHGLDNQTELLEWFVAETGQTPERLIVLLTPRFIEEADVYLTAHVNNGEIFGAPPDLGMLVRLYLRSYSAAYLTIRDMLKTLNPPVMRSAVLTLPFYAPERMNEARYEVFEGRMSKLHRWANERNVGFGVGYLPFVIEVRLAAGEVDEPNADEFDPDVALRFAGRATKALDVEFTSIRPEADALLATGERLSLRGDSHYDRKLSKVGADRLFDTLVAPHLERPTPEPKETPDHDPR